MATITKYIFLDFMYAGRKNKFYQVYFISSRKSNSVHPREHKIAAFIITTDTIHIVCTDYEDWKRLQTTMDTR
jgi:hypothetical protein